MGISHVRYSTIIHVYIYVSMLCLQQHPLLILYCICIIRYNVYHCLLAWNMCPPTPHSSVTGSDWRNAFSERISLGGIDPWLSHWVSKLSYMMFWPYILCGLVYHTYNRDLLQVSHQSRDTYWKHASICEDYSAIRCPVYMIGGWRDCYHVNQFIRA